MNGIKCDLCGTGYKPGQLVNCKDCGGEFCGTCDLNHDC